MKFPTMDEFAKSVAEKALDEIEYNGKTLREWTEIIETASEDTISRRAAIKEMFEHFGANSIEDIPLQQYWNPAHVIRVLEESPPVTYTKINPPSDYARQFGLIPKEDATKDSTNLAEVGTDCISRQAAIDALYSVDEYNSRSVKAIKQLPTIQPKRGKWVLVCDNNGMHFICNKCGAWRYHQEQKFCGECGADMRGKQDDSV